MNIKNTLHHGGGTKALYHSVFFVARRKNWNG